MSLANPNPLPEHSPPPGGDKDAAGYEQIRAWLSSRCGIFYPEHKSPVLRQRLVRVTRGFGYTDLNDLARGVVAEQLEEVQLAVMHAASTNHTYFFREPEVLRKFTDQILPQYRNKGDLRIWSAASSTGDEAYSIAILYAELFGVEALSKLHILGTDISGPVVERAEMGVYPNRQFVQTDPVLLRKYFTPTGIEQYQVRDDIRKTCTFRRMNLMAQPYPFTRPFQVVFCRNILYYFEKADQAKTLEAIYDVTEPGGWLVTSVTEAIRDLGSRWEPVSTGIYRRGKD
jgi:chemotaxis protein methyltransferase CheR